MDKITTASKLNLHSPILLSTHGGFYNPSSITQRWDSVRVEFDCFKYFHDGLKETVVLELEPDTKVTVWVSERVAERAAAGELAEDSPYNFD